MQGHKQFVRQGEATADTTTTRRKSLLDKGHDWELRVDLERMLVFPTSWKTNLRPDAVQGSQQSKTLVALELTVLFEEK